MSPQEVLDFAKKNDARQVDVRFSDIPGLQHHVSYPISELDVDSFENGFGIDGSSIRGWAAINESDMLLIPDPNTAFMDPFTEVPTLVMIGDVSDPITKQNYERDPRWIAKKAELFLKNTRPRRHGVLRRRSRVLHFRQHPLRSERALRLLFHRRRRGPLEFGPREGQPRLPAALQGRLLPGSADRSLPGPARRDGRDHDQVRSATSSATTTKSPPPASAKSISGSTRW